MAMFNINDNIEYQATYSVISCHIVFISKIIVFLLRDYIKYHLFIKNCVHFIFNSVSHMNEYVKVQLFISQIPVSQFTRLK